MGVVGYYFIVYVLVHNQQEKSVRYYIMCVENIYIYGGGSTKILKN